MPRILTTLLTLLLPLILWCQDLPDKDILRIYEKQLSYGLSIRSMAPLEIDRYLQSGRTSTPDLNEFARQYSELFNGSYNRQTAVLFFFFNADTLHRLLMRNGKLVERKYFAISRDNVNQLTSSLSRALRLEAMTRDRAPKPRGGNPVSTEKGPVITLEVAIKNAQRMLLPDKLDTTIKHLVIIPALSIGTFPFHLLKPYADGSYLGDRCSYTISPSLMDALAIRKRLLKKIPQLNSMTQASFTLEHPLFVCDPDFPKKAAMEFPPLPGTRKEITEAIRFAGSYVLLQGKEATKKNVMDTIRTCDLAYFATHGISADKNPLDNNFLVLSGEQDPYLSSRNILSLRDSTFKGDFSFPEMTILSACQSGLGQSVEAGVFGGMARSFLVAGSSCVIMSLWNVDDEATAYLMSRFIRYLQEPGPFMPSEPLRKAVMDTRKKYPDPIYWAGFSVFGTDY